MWEARVPVHAIDELDTSGFGADLAGKSVFLVVGDKDDVTPAATMFDPVVEAYQAVEGLELEHHTISGDHSFSWSRIELTRLVLDWARADCR